MNARLMIEAQFGRESIIWGPRPTRDPRSVPHRAEPFSRPDVLRSF
jgi:hypothetical protein